MAYKRVSILLFLLILAGKAYSQDYIVEDQGFGLTREELKQMITHWTPQMQAAAANDVGDRLELLNMSLAAKKIAAEAEAFTEQDDPGLYWAQKLRIQNTNRNFVVNNYMRALEMPDFTELAEERYQTEKDKYAPIPEERMTSHILFMCAPPECIRREFKSEVEQHWEALKSGASFEDMVDKYSDDPGSKKLAGKFDLWMAKGKFSNVAPQYHQATFKIGAIGEYSPVTESTFGFHIIRLDDIKPKSYRSYDEVSDQIYIDLAKEYRSLAAKEFDARYRISEQAQINGPVLDDLFEQYKTAQIAADVPSDNGPAREEALKNLSAKYKLAVDPNRPE
ncbi:MAG: parvulin-like peptidyl-prolyl isomerase [Alcanivorax sp.]|jgi:parvulin-like peptidyl-prolyl isomerase